MDLITFWGKNIAIVGIGYVKTLIQMLEAITFEVEEVYRAIE